MPWSKLNDTHCWVSFKTEILCNSFLFDVFSALTPLWALNNLFNIESKCLFTEITTSSRNNLNSKMLNFPLEIHTKLDEFRMLVLKTDCN